jgi:hypothetical protein
MFLNLNMCVYGRNHRNDSVRGLRAYILSTFQLTYPVTAVNRSKYPNHVITSYTGYTFVQSNTFLMHRKKHQHQ